MLDLARHEVEGRSQFANLGAARQLYSLREVPARNRVARFGQDFQWISNTPCRNDSDPYTQRDGKNGKYPRTALHFINAAVGFIPGLLNHNCPIQIRDRAVS